MYKEQIEEEEKKQIVTNMERREGLAHTSQVS